MEKIHTDYVNKIAIMVPEMYIDVKTGESHTVSTKVQNQIEYHAQNNTLNHLLFSALTTYLHPRTSGSKMEEILFELSQLKKMLQEGTYLQNHSYPLKSLQQKPLQPSSELDLKELEDVLDAFGG